MTRHTLVITFDFHPDADYSDLFAVLEEHNAFSISDSTWLLCTDADAPTIYDRLEDVYYDMSLVVLPLGDGEIGGSDDEIDGYVTDCAAE
ncbi:MAG: hypothetical protein AAF125_03020 [Chloroflexota bacterium]